MGLTKSRTLGEASAAAAETSSLDAFTRQQLHNALAKVAAYLASKQRTLTVVTVGGALNTLYLETRQSTHDVDFFTWQLEYDDIMMLKGAVELSAKKLNMASKTWLNNETSVFLPQPLRLMLCNEAVKQHEVVFEAKGLKVLAAPWRYSFVTKLDRMSRARMNDPGKSERPYDMTDALDYLEKVVEQRGEPITTALLLEWAKEFRLQPIIDEVVNEVRRDFRRVKGKDGIV